MEKLCKNGECQTKQKISPVDKAGQGNQPWPNMARAALEIAKAACLMGTQKVNNPQKKSVKKNTYINKRQQQ